MIIRIKKTVLNQDKKSKSDLLLIKWQKEVRLKHIIEPLIQLKRDANTIYLRKQVSRYYKGKIRKLLMNSLTRLFFIIIRNFSSNLTVIKCYLKE